MKSLLSSSARSTLMTTSAMITPSSKTDREKTIKELIKTQSPDHIPIILSGTRKISCPVIEVSVDLPIYRVDSSRTWDSQQLKIHEDELSETLFGLEHESTQETQQAQHDVLCYMAKDGGRNLFDLFKDKDPDESKYFIITSDGVLVNGNCRTAALRELIAQGEGRDALKTIFVAVIQEPVNREQMTSIEMNLQMADTFQLDYDWIQLTTLIQREKENGKTEAELKKYWTQFNLKGRLGSDYESLMQQRAELDTYLELSNSSMEIERIRRISGYDQLIKTFVERTSKPKWTKAKKDEVRKVLYPMISLAIEGESIPISGRQYTHLGNQIEQVGNHGGSKAEAILKSQGHTAEKDKGSSLVDQIKGAPEKKKATSLKKIVNLPKEDKKAFLVEITEDNVDLKNERKDRADKRAVKHTIGLIGRHLGNVIGFLQIPDISYDQDGVLDEIKEIRGMLDKIETLLK